MTTATLTPTVTSVVISPSSGDLDAGKVVTLTLNLSELVNRTGGFPTLTLSDGGTATYTGGSGTDALTFSYTVAAGQNTADLTVTAVNLGTAIFQDAAGNVANLSLTGLTQGGPQIDTTTPTVTSVVISPSSGDLDAGKVVTLTLNLSELVNRTGGFPTLTLSDGGTATYTGGSGTDALTFSYTVAAGQNTADLTVTAVNLGTAIFQDAAGNAANLSLTGLTQGGPQIDTTTPTVTSVVISPSSGDLDAGKVVTLTLNLSELVNRTGGKPTLTLSDGGTATYTGGSGTDALTFSYTVVAGQNTADLTVTAVNLGTAIFQDAAGNAANLSLTGLTQGGPQIATPPTVTSVVISPSTGDLDAGQTVTLTLNLSELVNRTGGKPTLTLSDGGTATYTGGSGTDALTFSYTVVAGQNTADLTVTAVNLGTAIFQDAAGNAANLSLTGLTQSGPQIDTRPPTVTSVVISPSTGDLDAGQTVTLTLNLSELVNRTGGTPTLTLNDGGTATYTGGSGTDALTFSYTVAAGQNTADLNVTAVNLGTAIFQDAAGNAANLSLTGLTQSGPQIDTIAPTAPVIASDTVNNNTVTLGGTAEASSTVTIYDNAVALGTTTASASGAWTYSTGTLANGSQDLTATATDAAGNTSALSNSVDPTIGSAMVTLSESTPWTEGAYTAYLSPWGAGTLQYGLNYTDSLTLSPSDFPNGVMINWSWPTSTSAAGLRNYDAIDFGNYDGTAPQTPISSTQIKDIGTLTQTENLVLGGNEGNYDVVTDMFLTSQAGNENTQVAEVEVFLHVPEFTTAWVNSLTEIGTFTDSGHTWEAAIGSNGTTPDIVIIPTDTSDVLSGSIDINAMLDYLVANGALTGNEYFNGLAMGAEVQQGTGSLGITNFAVTYSAEPTVTALLVSPASGDLDAGKTVTLTIALNENVTVNTAGGAPTLTLNDGATATYTGGSGNTLTFSYTVAAGQNTAGLAATAINLNGAKIADGAGNAANLSLGGVTQTGPQIDTTAPIAPVIVQDIVNTNDSVTLSGDAEAGSTVTVYDGLSVLGTTTVNSNSTWSFTTGTLAQGSQVLTATSTDNAGNTSAAETIDPTIGPVAPVISSIAELSSSGLGAGRTITLTLALSENVTVDTTGGQPTLTLNNGATATYVSSSGNTLNFSFSCAVAAGQTIAAPVATAINLNGATIADGAGNAANLSLSGVTQSDPPIIGTPEPVTGTPTHALSENVTVNTTDGASPGASFAPTPSDSASSDPASPGGDMLQNASFAAPASDPASTGGDMMQNASFWNTASVPGIAFGNHLSSLLVSDITVPSTMTNDAAGPQSTLGHLPNGNQDGGILSAANNNNAGVALLGNYMASSFAATSTGPSGTTVAADGPNFGNESMLAIHQHA